ncbi:hypothetical protein K439DRAFT_1623203 [Ramaria rubella]|nr:hypothetical protein K439DRAFT_1623203 [Ramaria rubella]
MALRRAHATAGFTWRCLKRKLGAFNGESLTAGLSNDEDVAITAKEESPDAGPSFRSIVQGLINEADEDDCDDDSDTERRIRCYFGRQERIPLAKLFLYPANDAATPTGRTQKGFDMFWKGAVANLEKEIELYELLADNEGRGQPGEPIVID